MSALPLCKDCRHFRKSPEGCLHQMNTRSDYVYGGTSPVQTPQWLRDNANRCGPKAGWWEPKEGA